MSLYKDLNNNIHDDDNGKALHLLPAGCVKITQAEADVIRNPPKTEEQLAEDAKRAKEEALKAITVTTTSGKVFDGNETARVNMLSAINSAALIGQTTANWKLADNTVVLVSLDEVKEALALSIQRVGEIVTA